MKRAKKVCPWCGYALRQATKAETERLRKLGTPKGYRMTINVYERCTACSWARTSATMEAA